MKVPASIRELYGPQKEVNDRLQCAIDRRMRGLKKGRWHYESRVKELSSFALKIESGRFSNLKALEDFFACTLVVANVKEIDEAEELVRSNFAVKGRRPPVATKTHKAADSFPFDDLRLYAALSDAPNEPPTDLVGITFEVQIKTFLQHAWAIATHDLLYKADDANWSKARIAYQIKAMLEHAEVSILEAERLAASVTLAKEDHKTVALQKGIALLKSQFTADELPRDIRRLAQNVITLSDALSLDIERLEQILNEGKATRAGAHPANLSPYGTVVQYLLAAERKKMLSFLSKDTACKVLVASEVELPAGIDLSRLRNALVVERSS